MSGQDESIFMHIINPENRSDLKNHLTDLEFDETLSNNYDVLIYHVKGCMHFDCPVRELLRSIILWLIQIREGF